MSKAKHFIFDVMLHDRFVCTLRYPLERARFEFINGKFEKCVELDELTAFVEEKRPTLKGKDYNIVW